MIHFQATLEVMTLVIGLFAFVERGFITTLDAIGWVPDEFEEEYLKEIRDYTKFMYFLVINVRSKLFLVCFPQGIDFYQFIYNHNSWF